MQAQNWCTIKDRWPLIWFWLTKNKMFGCFLGWSQWQVSCFASINYSILFSCLSQNIVWSCFWPVMSAQNVKNKKQKNNPTPGQCCSMVHHKTIKQMSGILCGRRYVIRVNSEAGDMHEIQLPPQTATNRYWWKHNGGLCSPSVAQR